MNTVWNFFAPQRLMFGWGAVREAGAAVQRLNVERVLIVSDKTLVAAGLVAAVESSLCEAGLTAAVFDGGEPEPDLECARRAAAVAREFDPDAFVGVGGGSNLDLTKMVAIVTSHGGDFADYFGFDRVPGPVRPLICVPTTAGTGSEVSHAAVLTDRENAIKVSTLSPHLRPQLAVVDPELTASCPRHVTAESGIDALTHAVEAVLATRFSEMERPRGTLNTYEGQHPLGDLLAERAIRLIAKHLETAVNEPHNASAREGMALAATLAGLAFSNCGVALVHAMEYPLGGAVHCSHGAGNGLLLPYVMRYNLPCRVPELARIAEWLGCDPTGMSEEEAAYAACDAVEGLKLRIGIPARIRDLGAQREQLPEFAKKAFAIKRLMDLTPRQPSEASILAVYEEAF